MSSPQTIYALREVGSQGLGTINRELGRSQPDDGNTQRKASTTHHHLSAGQIVCGERKQPPPPPACDRRAPAIAPAGVCLSTAQHNSSAGLVGDVLLPNYPAHLKSKETTATEQGAHNRAGASLAAPTRECGAASGQVRYFEYCCIECGFLAGRCFCFVFTTRKQERSHYYALLPHSRFFTSRLLSKMQFMEDHQGIIWDISRGQHTAAY
jgi:hypothetical protein